MSVLRFLRNKASDFCLGCSHHRLSRPFTIEKESYMVCLACGKQFFYSFDMMRRLSEREVRHMRAVRNATEPLSSARVTSVPATAGDNQAA
jgi:hypothetical protein